MDFTSILSNLRTALPPKPPVIESNELFRKAQAMAGRGYIHSSESLRALHAYMQGYGVLISGAVGVGKTLFFELVEHEPLPVLSFNTCSLWTFDRLDEWLDEHRGVSVVLDDLGWDAEKSRNYGQRFEALQVILDRRLIDCNARTHITTNFSNDELIERYDAHLVDRIYQLCKCFVFPQTESMREATPNATYLRNIEHQRKIGKEVL